ncbi:hypothetical protein VZC37_03310 [Gordonia sp. LSe1-13]|uniref:Uncharacterized protein n=2 Tax=Gordonia TaxID=2053 RepID=A0ABU7M894_9ACTN|nr:hypothetical protein [Gordonia sp. LSe1-13]MEE4026084.1 hypothetical protein [Gordonia sp. PKS22-38]
MSGRANAVVIRSIYGTAAVEWFLIFAIATILLTRLYLQLAGYPQVGGGTLHIAHALWGGALMMLALIVGWLFLGPATRVASIVMGGIGFGLFLDEIGKFVTKDNDYFYGPSAEIMYILVVAVLLLSRIVRDVKKPTVAEAMANAATIAADGVSHGLPRRRRRQADEFLAIAADRGADPIVIEHIRGLLAASRDTPDRLMRLRDRATGLIPQSFRSPRWVAVVGWLIVITSAATLIVGVLAVVVNDRDMDGQVMDDIEFYFEISRNATASWILFVSSVVTLALSLPAMIARRRADRLWPLRSLRLAALVFTVSNALVDFALDGFGALVNLAIGLFSLAIISYHLGEQVTTPRPDTHGLRV